jgi:hypothetical protein
MRYARAMRGVVLLLLAGCTGSQHDDVDEFGRCRSDTACVDSEVCARNGACYPPSELRAVSVTWTIGGMAADPVTCAASPDLFIAFSSGGSGPFAHLEFSPVPCRAGRFSIDELPTEFTSVQLSSTRGRLGQHGQLDAATGEAMLDLSL